MIQRRTFVDLNREPLYNTRAVERRTSVPADTFRAWERRYGMPRPFRTPANQRLYSERDMAVITWLRDRTTEGMNISQAIQRLRIEHVELFRDAAPPPAHRADAQAGGHSLLAELSERLVDTLIDVDGIAADRLIDEALDQFTLETACLDVIRPALVEIGVRWERGDCPAGIEHFATRVITRRLLPLVHPAYAPGRRGKIVTVCAPGEEHELGGLMLSIFLGRRNWSVTSLGAGLPVDDLVATIEHIEPDLVCISASMPRTAAHAVQAAEAIPRAGDQPPAVVVGGRAFANSATRDLAHARGVHCLDGSPDELDRRIAALIDQRLAQPRSR